MPWLHLHTHERAEALCVKHWSVKHAHANMRLLYVSCVVGKFFAPSNSYSRHSGRIPATEVSSRLPGDNQQLHFDLA